VEETFVEPLLHKPITPSLVGGEFRVLPTATVGPFGIWRRLDEMGVEATKPEIEAVLADCRALIQAENRPVTDADLMASLSRVRGASAEAT
jgi:isopropylmalate/homocitrate/citramalate synthase